MSNDSAPSEPAPSTGPLWQPLSAQDRRVVGVLIEKAKTTPDQYPLTLNALSNGCNQKSNRDPVMNLDVEDVEASIERLRPLGAVALVHGGGRVSKCRHYMYDWLGVDKVELAVMAELLLRGPQTEGELRGRAARMEPIADLAALRPVLDSLKSKGLVVPLTPEGRGHVVTHALYPPEELARVRGRFGSSGEEPAAPREPRTTAEPQHAIPAPPTSAPPAPSPAGGTASTDVKEMVDSLQAQVRELSGQVAELKATVSDLARALDDANSELATLKRDLGT